MREGTPGHNVITRLLLLWQHKLLFDLATLFVNRDIDK